jgi:hypothetical protein
MKHGLGLALCFVVSMMLPTKGESFSFDEVGVLVNETTGAISVTYSARIVVATDGTRYCGIPSDLFLAAAPTREGKVGDGIRPPSMRGVVFDKAACTASFRLGSSQAAYNVFRFELCADHAADTRGGDYPKTPFFQTLSITAGGRAQIWRGWAAVEQFKRSPFGDCVFRFRDAATSR